MTELSELQLGLIALVFVWSGFVRSGLGFGGAVLSLPFLLLIHNDVLVFLPIIAVHLMFFSSLIFVQSHYSLRSARQSGGHREANVDWPYLRKSLGIMILPKLIGVFGLITLPPKVMGVLVFIIVAVYALSYVFNRPIRSRHRSFDVLFLAIGAYISGTSLIGAPLITVVYASHVAMQKLRDTLFALWFILVAIKVAAFLYFDVDMQWIHHLWLLPCAALGHYFGLKFHSALQRSGSTQFYRVLGAVILMASATGLYRTFAG